MQQRSFPRLVPKSCPALQTLCSIRLEQHMMQIGHNGIFSRAPAETEHIGHIILMGRSSSSSTSLPGCCRQLRAHSNWHMASVWRSGDQGVASDVCHCHLHCEIEAGGQCIPLSEADVELLLIFHSSSRVGLKL